MQQTKQCLYFKPKLSLIAIASFVGVDYLSSLALYLSNLSTPSSLGIQMVLLIYLGRLIQTALLLSNQAIVVVRRDQLGVWQWDSQDRSRQINYHLVNYFLSSQVLILHLSKGYKRKKLCLFRDSLTEKEWHFLKMVLLYDTD